ncbi:MAG TPA: CHASE4 domain-containing protein, partial [Chloroflexia bacterium]|nr:CHASE4 domain-containing protein [Chloroflexia bacterium]
MFQMTLQKKTLLIIALTLGVPILVLYFTSQAIVLGRFSSIENDEAVQNIQRVQSALDDDLTALESTTRDWSMWDDTFQFIADRNQDYIESNLTGSLAMDNNRLDVMLFYDAQGNEVFAKASDYQGGSQTPQPTSLLSRIGPDSPLLQHTSAASSIKGLISLPEGAMLLASEPIMHSSGEGEIGGTLIFGRFLNTDAIEHLAKTTLIGLSLTPLSSLSASEDPEGPVPQLSVEAPMQLIARSDDKLDGYYLLTDVLGNPALVLEAEMPRVVYNKGVQNLYSYLLILLTVGILLGVVMTLLMKRLVLSRLALLRHEMGKISLSSDISHRVNMPGKDEFSDLSISINDMLAALHRSREEQWESEQRYKAVVEQTREAIFLVDAVTGHFVEANASFQAMLDYTFDELTKLRLADITVSGGDKTG